MTPCDFQVFILVLSANCWEGKGIVASVGLCQNQEALCCACVYEIHRCDTQPTSPRSKSGISWAGFALQPPSHSPAGMQLGTLSELQTAFDEETNRKDKWENERRTAASKKRLTLDGLSICDGHKNASFLLFSAGSVWNWCVPNSYCTGWEIPGFTMEFGGTPSNKPRDFVLSGCCRWRMRSGGLRWHTNRLWSQTSTASICVILGRDCMVSVYNSISCIYSWCK